MSFNSKGVDSSEKKGMSQFMSYGEQQLKINKFEVKTASTGAKQVILHMETLPVNTAVYSDFTPHADSTTGGQIGKASMYGAWLKDVNDASSETHQKFQRDVALIADKMGVRSKLDSIQAEDFEDYVNKLNGVLTGSYKYWKICVEEYPRDGKGPGTKYTIGRYSKTTIAVADTAGKIKFDKNNAYDYKPLDAVVAKKTEDLPF